ncbi:dTDP-4-dehydrorhamnose 3,5-epimerase [Methylobacterium sp. 4-46]|uniref:dTDP-4-dehydrorhamnose 3,5-epimerase n=1 Tax=unclassified Methylobacterium TaxID=2615210 RepID=UPI000152EA49|nr:MULTISPECIES: dTDP-4-dehydrorhamnose 3,5-epimerase [Methylobacterium]ACA20122.1 dTDP-4-dehydrorhamnose 3,5-epimerase [Methylobacterium sp. 4-46]WFT79303.1 dTDP-4-dehydrorhamnose 3,5-epimerase [Methylobacterium nodulans]
MRIVDQSIPDVKLVVPARHGDARGWFSETYRADLLAQAGITDLFIQDNQSFSAQVGTVRGIHFQTHPHAQGKLVRVVSGAILDVAVDLRRASPSYGRHVAVRLDAENGHQLYVPVGFGHAFCTLEPDTAIAYKVSGGYYSPAHDGALLWNDPDLGIDWPVSPEAAILSAKDKAAPRLADLPAHF